METPPSLRRRPPSLRTWTLDSTRTLWKLAVAAVVTVVLTASLALASPQAEIPLIEDVPVVGEFIAEVAQITSVSAHNRETHDPPI